MSTSKIRIKTLVLMAWALLIFAVSALADTAPDATLPGPFMVTSAEYRFPATADPDVLLGRSTELWARVYRPTDLSGGPFPLVVFLHGNHATCGRGSNPRIDDNCQYSITGTCPGGYVVVSNHLGYGYLAERLASWGYIVVSINANRGINCFNDGPTDFGLVLARGRLVLKHLQRLSEWNTRGGTPPSLGVDLRGKIDFSSVGLMGHSRGGEGMRAAYNQYRDVGSPWPARIPDPTTFQGIFEIGPVDGQSNRTLNADGAVWNVLLPMCDGDIFDLQGVRTFDRMMRIFSEDPATQKSTYTVWGANHNFYNTEWQANESAGCIGHTPLFPTFPGSPQQRQTGLASVLALFRGNVGPNADPAFNQNFNPQFELPLVVTSVTRVDRGFTDSPSSDITLSFEDFDQPTGTNTYGFENNASNITINHGPVPNHSDCPRTRPELCVQRAGVISWQTAGANTYFQTNWTDEGSGNDISTYQTLDLRVSRQSNNLNPAGPTNFSIQLVMADGTLSAPVPLNAYTDLRGPVGGLWKDEFGQVREARHPILQTARIPLTDLTDADLTQVRGVRLTFDGTTTGAIYVANIRLSALSGSGLADFSETAANLSVGYSPSENWAELVDKINAVNIINSIRTVASSSALDNNAGVEIELVSTKGFPVRNELVVLRIGAKEFLLSRYPEDGNTNTLIFTLTLKEFAQTATGDPVIVQYGRGESNDQRDFGRLDKSLLDK